MDLAKLRLGVGRTDPHHSKLTANTTTELKRVDYSTRVGGCVNEKALLLPIAIPSEPHQRQLSAALDRLGVKRGFTNPASTVADHAPVGIQQRLHWTLQLTTADDRLRSIIVIVVLSERTWLKRLNRWLFCQQATRVHPSQPTFALAYPPTVYLPELKSALQPDLRLADLVDDVPTRECDPWRRTALEKAFVEILLGCAGVFATSSQLVERYSTYAPTISGALVISSLLPLIRIWIPATTDVHSMLVVSALMGAVSYGAVVGTAAPEQRRALWRLLAQRIPAHGARS